MQMMKIDGLKMWLMTKPDPNSAIAYSEFVDYWSEQLKNGGFDFAKETRKLVMEYLRDITPPQP